jgi:hypothetical protein
MPPVGEAFVPPFRRIDSFASAERLQRLSIPSTPVPAAALPTVTAQLLKSQLKLPSLNCTLGIETVASTVQPDIIKSEFIVTPPPMLKLVKEVQFAPMMPPPMLDNAGRDTEAKTGSALKSI